MKRLLPFGVLALTAGIAACGSDEGTPAEEDSSVSDSSTNETITPMDSTAETTGDTAADTSADTPTDGTATGPTLDMQILNVSDWHGQIDPLSETNSATGVTTTYAGVPVLSSYWQKDRAANPNSITVTQGDVTGATPSLSTNGADLIDEPAIRSMLFLGLQVDTLGNHNFDRGINGTNGYAKLLDIVLAAPKPYKVVSTNLNNVATEFNGGGVTRVVTPTTILEVGAAPNTVKVGFIGITGPDAPKLVFPGGMASITVAEPSGKVNEASAALRAAGANVVVVLAHMGATGTDAGGAPTGPLIDLAKAVNVGSVDLLLGDHTNQRVNTKINGIPVTENLSLGRTYGRTKISVANGKVTAVTPEIVEPVGTKLTKTEVLNDSAGMPVACSSTTACPTATAAWKCTSTTAASGICTRAITDCTSANTCGSGFTCDSAGGTAKLQCTDVVMAGDPAFAAISDPWRANLAQKFDVKVGLTAGKYLRGPTCPPSATCPPTPTVYLERRYEQPLGDLMSDMQIATLKPLGAQIALANGGGIRAPLPSSYAPKLFSSVTATGTFPPALAVAGTPDADHSVRIEVTKGGALGTMEFRYSLDGGTTWAMSNIVSAAGGGYALGSTGVNLTFASGTYTADNVYTFSTKYFVRTGCSAATPCDVLLGDIYTILPFGNRTTLRPVTVNTLWQDLENSVGVSLNLGGFLQVGGFKFTWSLSATSGARVRTITLDDGTKLMDLDASPPLTADTGKACTADADCGAHFTCVTDVDTVKKCMILVATNDFINSGGETKPMAAGQSLGTKYSDLGDDMAAYIADYVKKKGPLMPGTTNYTAPSTSDPLTRIIELP